MSFRDHLLDYTLQRTLHSEYEDNNYAFINAHRSPSTPDSKEYWIDLLELEDYITYLKDEAQSLGYENLGIKIKMGQYPPTAVISPEQNPNYKGYQNVFIVPTRENSSGNREEISDINGFNYTELHPPG